MSMLNKNKTYAYNDNVLIHFLVYSLPLERVHFLFQISETFSISEELFNEILVCIYKLCKCQDFFKSKKGNIS